jgi:hypothetical protein
MTAETNAPNGLYTISIEMRDGRKGRASGVLILCDGRILGGDSYFYYAGSYTYRGGKWRGELITRQHTEAIGKNLVFGRWPSTRRRYRAGGQDQCFISCRT